MLQTSINITRDDEILRILLSGSGKGNGDDFSMPVKGDCVILHSWYFFWKKAMRWKKRLVLGRCCFTLEQLQWRGRFIAVSLTLHSVYWTRLGQTVIWVCCHKLAWRLKAGTISSHIRGFWVGRPMNTGDQLLTCYSSGVMWGYPLLQK